ncbi:melanocyte-stimulating hormone receptor-like [Porites lutea]|uniref:melanocyte-stimulating hormone receptor-like n=1 Tax=Porites lutea TaxID=51062 RepID=UPI003CC5DC28
MVNLTEGGNVTVTKTLLSANVRVGLYIAIAAVNIVFSITASLGNILILIALRKVTSIHPPTKLLFQCLAITDLGVGLISQPLMATVMLLVDNIDIKIVNIMFAHLFSSLSITFCGVSVFASTSLSVDRLLALFLGLRYRHVVTLKRIRAVLACGCLAVLLTVLVWNFRTKPARIIMTISLTLCLIISLFCYGKIVLRLRQHQSSVRDNDQQGQANTGGSPLNLERYKRTVVSVALVQLALVICYLPFNIFNTLIHLKGIHPNIYFLYDFTTTLLFLNSSLNPFLYCWRIKEIRQAVKATIKRFCTCLSQGTSTLSTNQ